MRSLPGKREIGAELLGRGSLMGIARAQRNTIRILAYHRVLPGNCAEWCPVSPNFIFDDGVVSATSEAFRNQMGFVRRNFDVISFRDLYYIESRGLGLPARPLIITFDDGYRDNYTNAFPVLKEFGIPATIFVATGHIGSNTLFWWDLVAYCFKIAAPSEVLLEEVSVEPLCLGTLGGRRSAIDRVLKWMKRVPDEVRARFVERLPEVLGITITPALGQGMHLG